MIEPERITAEEVKLRMDTGEAVVFLDSRPNDAWRTAEWQIPKSRRVSPDHLDAHLDKEAPLGEVPRRRLVVPYCNSPQEESSARVAQALAQHGWTNVRPLLGGLAAWRRAGCPTEAKPTRRQTRG